MEETDTVRVNKRIAHATGMSRREADNAIAAGRVIINGTRAVMGSQATQKDTVLFDGQPIDTQTTYTYLLLNKPTGYVCSRRRQGDNPTIYELLDAKYRLLKPVGRLDRDSSGILLLTDDGDLAHRMTHPKFKKRKVYDVELDHDLEPLHHQMISDHGVTLEDGVSQLILEKRDENNAKSWRVTMHEGRNRQIRRTFAALGYTVTRLHRIEFGPYSTDGLELGTIKQLDKI